MKRSFWLPYAAMLRPRWILAALLLQWLALGALLVWADDAGTTIGLAMTAAGITSFWLWAAPGGSLLLHLHQGRELRLPRQGAGCVSRTTLLLVANLAPASALIFWRAHDADRAVFMSLVLLAILLGQLLFLVTPFRLLAGAVLLAPLLLAVAYLLAPLLPGSLVPIEWNDGWRIVVALAVVGAAGTALLVLGQRFVSHPGRARGTELCVLDLSAGSASAHTTDKPERGLRALPEFVLPRQRVRPGDSVERRLAHLLGPPYAPGSTRRLLVVLGVVGLLVALIGALSKPGVRLELFVAQTWLAVCISFTVSTRLATLFRSRAPELSELALLPGQGNAAQRRQRLMRLLLWRPLVGQLALTAAVMVTLWAIGLARSWSQAGPLLCLSLLAAALMTWETARYIDRGEGWFGQPWVGSAVYAAALVPWVMLLMLTELDSTRWSGPAEHAQAAASLAAIALAVFSAWRAHAAQRRSIERPRILAEPGDRAAAAHRA